MRVAIYLCAEENVEKRRGKGGGGGRRGPYVNNRSFTFIYIVREKGDVDQNKLIFLE